MVGKTRENVGRERVGRLAQLEQVLAKLVASRVVGILSLTRIRVTVDVYFEFLFLEK